MKRTRVAPLPCKKRLFAVLEFRQVSRMSLLSREYHKNSYKTLLVASIIPANSLGER